MSQIVRVSLDLLVERGDAEEVSKVLYEHRKDVLDFAAHVVLSNNDSTSTGYKFTSYAGSTHVHPDVESTGERCTECSRYAGKSHLSLIEP